MTYKAGRLGQKFHRAGLLNTAGQWAAGTPASGGFTPQGGVRFAGTADPLCPPHAPCASTDESGRTFSAVKPLGALKSKSKGLRRKGRKRK
jgi:hypothetical protein